MTDEYGHRLKAFSLRMEKTLRKDLEAEAKKNGRTLTGEINYRLERSLMDTEVEHFNERALASLARIEKAVVPQESKIKPGVHYEQ